MTRRKKKITTISRNSDRVAALQRPKNFIVGETSRTDNVMCILYINNVYAFNAGVPGGRGSENLRIKCCTATALITDKYARGRVPELKYLLYGSTNTYRGPCIIYVFRLEVLTSRKGNGYYLSS